MQYIQESIPDYRNGIIVARHPGVVRKATSYAERLRIGIAVIHGEQKESESDQVDGRSSPPPVKAVDGIDNEIPVLAAKEKPPINIVGDVGGRIAIMIDNVIDDVQSYVSAAEVLREHGAYKIYVLATHGLFYSDAPRLLEDSAIDEVIVTNTSIYFCYFALNFKYIFSYVSVPHELQKMRCHKIKTIDIATLLAEAMRRIHNGESLSYLFKNVTLED